MALNRPAAILTTSWDDGYPLDLRVAELLEKYGLRGTFYIPVVGRGPTLAPGQLRDLSTRFEIGSHTYHEAYLPPLDDARAFSELADSKAWLEDITGVPCYMLSPVGGRFRPRQLDLVRRAGYGAVRTVEMFSRGFPRRRRGLYVMPTTIQVKEHQLEGYLRNFAKRLAVRNLWAFAYHLRVRRAAAQDWPRLAESLLVDVVERGGVFHVWGHSWEIQDHGEWERLEQLLKLMSQLQPHAASLTNGDLCRAVGATPSPTEGLGSVPSRAGRSV